MHLSMHNWMRAEPIETTIRRLAACGYDSIEISGEPDMYNTTDVRKLLRDNALRCWGAVTLMIEGRDMVHADERVRDASVRYVKDCVTMVKELDGYQLSIVPSQVGKTQPMAGGDEEWAWAIEGLREVYEHSQREGVILALEPINRFETYFLNRHDQALLLAESVGPDCGVCLDAFHINIEEADPFGAILATGDKLVGFHVCDTNRMAPGQGAYDWVRVLKTLKEIGYDGALTIEFVAPIDRTPANPYVLAQAGGDEEIPAEQLKFIEDHGGGALSDEFYTGLVEFSGKTLREALRQI